MVGPPMALNLAAVLGDAERDEAPPAAAVKPTCEHGAGPDDLCMLCPEDVAIHRLFQGGLEPEDLPSGVPMTDELLRDVAADLRRRFACDFESVVDRILAADRSPAILRAMHDGLQRAYLKMCDEVGRPAFEFRDEFEARWAASPPRGKPIAASRRDIRCVVVQIRDVYGWRQREILTVASNHAAHAARIAVEAAKAIGCEVCALRAVAGDERPKGGAR
jgi:hypothetical protein